MGKQTPPRYGADAVMILPPNISTDYIRVVRDHVMRSREEIQRVAKKLPEIHSRWSYMRGMATTIDLADLLEALIDLQNWVDREYLIRAARPDGTTNQRGTINHSPIIGRMHRRAGDHHVTIHDQRTALPKTVPPPKKPEKPLAVLLRRPKSEDEIPLLLED